MTDLNKTTGLTSLLIASPVNDTNGSVDSNPGPTIVNGQPVSAILELRSTDGALLISRMTTSDRNDLNPGDGMIMYNKDTNSFNLRVNGEWVDLVSIDVDGVENDIVVFGANPGSLKDSGVTIADFFPPQIQNINSLLAPGNDIAISKLSYLQFIENSGFVFLGLQAGVQLFSQPSPQNICVLVTDGGIPPSPSSPSCAIEINTRNGALLLSRMLDSNESALASPSDGMLIYNESSGNMRLRQAGSWVNVKSNNVTIITENYNTLLSDSIIGVSSVSPTTITLNSNPSIGQTYQIMDISGNSGLNTISANGNGIPINGFLGFDNDVSVNLGTAPTQVATSFDGVRSFFTNYLSNNVYVISSGAPVIYNVGTEPRGIAIRPNNADEYVYVCNRSSNNISITKNLLITYEYGPVSRPWMIAFTPDGNYLYVTNNDVTSPSVYVFTISNIDGNLSPLTTINLPSELYTYGITVTPDGNYVYVTTRNGVTVIQGAQSGTPSVLINIPLNTGNGGATSVVITPNGEYAYVSSNSTIISIIQGASSGNPSLLGTINSTTPCFGLSITPNGEMLYICNTSSNSVTIMRNASEGSPIFVKNVTVGNGPFGIAINPSALGGSVGYYAWVCDSGSNTGHRIKDASGKIVNIVDTNYSSSSLTYTGTGWNASELIAKPTNP